jgi:lysozyme family protein
MPAQRRCTLGEIMPEIMGFARALPVILKFEGGKVDDPADPGGRTNKGITQRVYDRFRQRRARQPRDVYQITDDEVAEIYHDQYWALVKADQLPAGVDLVVFDGAVHSGVSASIKWLQRALGVDDDGILGPVTLSAINRTVDNDQLIADIIALRERFLKTLKTFKRFGKGWLGRTLQVEQIGQAWATGSVGPQPNYVEGMHAKANPEAQKAPPARGVADAATGGGIGSLGLSQVISGLQEQLTPFSLSSAWIAKLVVALILIGAVLTVAGLAWRAWAMWKKHKIEEASV